MRKEWYCSHRKCIFISYK